MKREKKKIEKLLEELDSDDDDIYDPQLAKIEEDKRKKYLEEFQEKEKAKLLYDPQQLYEDYKKAIEDKNGIKMKELKNKIKKDIDPDLKKTLDKWDNNDVHYLKVYGLKHGFIKN